MAKEAEAPKTISATYRPAPGEPRTVRAFGDRLFKEGEAVELPAEFADKVRGNPHFAVEGEKTYGDDVAERKPPEPQPEASFEDNVDAAHRAEYGTDDPETVDAMRRAREHNSELNAARRSQDRDPPAEETEDKPARRRGRRPAAETDDE